LDVCQPNLAKSPLPSGVPLEKFNGFGPPSPNGWFRQAVFGDHRLDEVVQVFRERLVDNIRFEPSQEPQESPSDSGKV
jgi:hypothetical protein